jgi:hypothetical protein
MSSTDNCGIESDIYLKSRASIVPVSDNSVTDTASSPITVDNFPDAVSTAPPQGVAAANNNIAKKVFFIYVFSNVYCQDAQR